MQEDPNSEAIFVINLIYQIGSKKLRDNLNKWIDQLREDPTIPKFTVCRGGAVFKEPENFNALVREWVKSQTE